MSNTAPKDLIRYSGLAQATHQHCCTVGEDASVHRVHISGSGNLQQKVSTVSCQEVTRERLRLHLQMRRPAEFAIDHESLNTPIHRLLESAESRAHPEQTAETLHRLLTDLASVGFLGTYINLSNRCGSTPLSICMLNEQYSCLISLLISHGAQLHHLCGNLSDRCNHLHFAMSKATPRTIDSTLDEVFRTYPSGADGMYAQNRRGETPKAALMRRIEEAAVTWREPHLPGQLARILERIPAYPPYCGLPQQHQQFHHLQQQQPPTLQPELSRLYMPQLDVCSGR